MFNAELLKSPKVQAFIEIASKRKMDVLQISSALSKDFTNEERAAIMDYMGLLPKIREKFFVGGNGASNASGNSASSANSARTIFLLCDKLALEQSTAQDIGRWKSKLWSKVCPAENDSTVKVVHDLCCGMGGDSFFLPRGLTTVGVDLDSDRLAMYRNNMQAMRGCDPNSATIAIQGDVREIAKQNGVHPDKGASPDDLNRENSVRDTAIRADYFTIDPARRAVDGENQRDLRNLTPTLAEVVEIARHYKGGMAKLPPGYPVREIPDECEIVYAGGHGDCRECLVLFGELANEPATMHAVMVDKSGCEIAQWSRKRDKDFEVLDDDLQEKLDKNDQLEGCDRTYRTSSSKSDLPLGEISKYLSEPAPLLVRSRLFNLAALEAASDAHLVSEGIAYVASEVPLPAPGFACFEVLNHCEISTSSVRAMLKAHDVGKLTLKLRGVKIDPDAEIKRLKPKGKNAAILFYTRVAGEKTAILAKNFPQNQST